MLLDSVINDDDERAIVNTTVGEAVLLTEVLGRTILLPYYTGPYYSEIYHLTTITPSSKHDSAITFYYYSSWSVTLFRKLMP